MFNGAMDVNRMEDFKVLLTIRSPTLIAMQAPKRWEGFNQGSSLVIDSQGKNSIAFSLIYPAHLFSVPALATFDAIISASVSAAGGQRPVAVVTDSKPTHADFFLKWGL